MCCDEDRLSRSRTMRNRQRPASMQTPGRSKSLLVDYSKQRVPMVEEELKALDDILIGTSSHHSKGTFGGDDNDDEDDFFHDSFAKENNDSFNMTDTPSLTMMIAGGRRGSMVKAIQEDQEVSNSSLGMPDLAPMEEKGSDQPAKQGEEEISHNSFSANDTTSNDCPATPRRNTRNNRRNLMASTRMHQSLSSLNYSASPNALSFSLRRRTSVRRGPPTEGEGGSSTLDRFHSSLAHIDFQTDDLLDSPSVHTTRTTRTTSTGTTHSSKVGEASPQQKNPSRDRRSMLVRHSSVSALESGDRQFKVDIASPIATRGASRKSMLQRSATVEPRGSHHLPGSIQISKPRRSASSRTLGSSRHSTTSNHGSSSHNTNHKSINGSSHHSRRSTNTTRSNNSSTIGGSSHHSRQSRGVRSNRTMPKMMKTAMEDYVDDDEERSMSASTQSYFGTSSRRRQSATGAPPSRRDVMVRQLSSRRHLGTNVKSQRSLLGDSNKQRNTMDDSSFFVTGSRIRRGSSCRQLLC
ncbi:expressed unknown protein [Seminavis robusta]|uniref:Uncharacterized protein n=1 Tax=Seminavis robusta TaxID=568900 RepID=A0A9N8H524_9STRA|nr:expressed unknown protein [Seminavis robusta]|eukprot:Sro64_g036230.1 n/a (522) ;mRNA; f:48026-49591